MPVSKNYFLFKASFYILFIIMFTPRFFTHVFAEESLHIKSDYIVWISGNLPEGSEVKGKWDWDAVFTHDGASTHVHNTEGRISRRSFQAKDSIELDKGSKIIQYIYIDPRNIPAGIMLKLLIAPPGEAMIFYWEGYEEAFAELDEYINAWYMGFMPDSGKWVELFIDFSELDMPKIGLSGIEFILSNGRAWWGRTIIERNS